MSPSVNQFVLQLASLSFVQSVNPSGSHSVFFSVNLPTNLPSVSQFFSFSASLSFILSASQPVSLLVSPWLIHLHWCLNIWLEEDGVQYMSVLKEFIEAIFLPISEKSWEEGKKNYESPHLTYRSRGNILLSILEKWAPLFYQIFYYILISSNFFTFLL